MIQYPILLGLGFICMLPFKGFAQVPVVNKGIQSIQFDQEQAISPSSPVTLSKSKTRFTSVNKEEEIALAHESYEGSIHSEEAFLNKLQDLQQEISELRTQLEKQTENLKLLQQQQITFYKDLDSRLQQTPKANDTASADLSVSGEQLVSLSASSPKEKKEIVEALSPKSLASGYENSDLGVKSLNQIDTANEQISYLAAYDLLKNKRFDDALSAMKIFTLQYPRGGYTANAQYWLGELYMVKNNYPKAIEHFEMVLKKFPSSSKRAASTLKIGYALAASGKVDEAKIRLEEVLRNYPDTPTAQLAIIKLESLGVS